MFRKSISVVVAVGVLTQSLACSFASPSSQSIVIRPSNEHAEVFVDGARVGTGTTTIDMSKGRTHSVMAQCGHSTGVAQVDRSISTSGILDIIGGFILLIPLIGVFADGFWELEPTTVVVAIPDAAECVDQKAGASWLDLLHRITG